MVEKDKCNSPSIHVKTLHPPNFDNNFPLQKMQKSKFPIVCQICEKVTFLGMGVQSNYQY